MPMIETVLKRFEEPDEVRDSWVVGDVPYISLHFLWADRYANE
jgi:hypothetical protein